MIDPLLPPHSQEAEQGVLGCLLLSPNEMIPVAMEKLHIHIEPFYDLRHRAIYDALLAMYDARVLMDLIGLQQYLKDRNQLEALGGMPYFASLMNCVPSAANLEYYIEIVNEKAYERAVIQKCTSIIGRIYAGELHASELSDQLETEVQSLTREKKTRPTRLESFNKIIDELERTHRGDEIPGLLLTGFPDLDQYLGGLLPGDHIVIAARPGLGKSTLSMNVAEYNAIDCKIPVGYFSLEMSEEKLNKRSLASRSRQDLSVYKDRHSNLDYPTRRIRTVLSTLIKAPIEIDFSPGISIMKLRARARQMALQNKIKLLIVDMIQLVTGRSPKRSQEVGEVSRGLKMLAGELNIPIISISSMNREIEKSDNRRPRLSDLKESGDIESDADTVIFLWQPDQTAEREGIVPTNVFIAKNRNGDTGEISLSFHKRISRFESVSKVADVPDQSNSRDPYSD